MRIRRSRNRRKPPERPSRLALVNWGRLLRWIAGLTATAAAGVAVAVALNRPIQTVAVSGRFDRVSAAQVAQAVKTSLHGAGFLVVNLDAVRAAVERLPWVDSASVARRWPHGLVVRIVEEVPAARWAGGGLINVRGVRFASDPRAIPPGLPLLSGPRGSAKTVAERYFTMQARLSELGLRITAVTFDPRGAWQFKLADGVEVRLGRNRIDERFETFMTVAAKIVAARASAIAYVDMRYMNGFAIGWRPGHAPRKANGEES